MKGSARLRSRIEAIADELRSIDSNLGSHRFTKAEAFRIRSALTELQMAAGELQSGVAGRATKKENP